MVRTVARWTNDDAESALCSGDAELHRVAVAHHAIVVEASTNGELDAGLNFEPLVRRGVIVAVHGGQRGTIAPSADLWLSDTVKPAAEETELERFVRIVGAFPHAAVVCARQLRLAEACNLGERAGALRAVEIESLAYATLQAGPEFAEWLGQQGRRVRPDNESNIVVVNEEYGSVGDTAGVTVQLLLNRPRLKNSLNAAMRDRLIELLDALSYRSDVASISLRGNGSAFCIGGDLAEFGVVSDPTNAHLIRMAASLPARLLNLEIELHARPHGTVVGAGVELAAFADLVVADPDTTFRLPEVSMGLLPGAGGTVSVTRRIGRQNAARLLLLEQTIDATEALELGLVDAIEGTT